MAANKEPGREQNQLISVTDLKKYRTELPNLYDDADLDPFEFRLLVHYVRVGNCYEGVRTTARKCKMSHPVVIDKRRSLETKGFIRTKIIEEGGTVHIEVIDRWLENFCRYSGIDFDKFKELLDKGNIENEGGGSQVEQVVATLNTLVATLNPGGSQVYLKNQQKIKKEPLKNDSVSASISEGQTYLLSSLGGKRLNPKQKDTLIGLEQKYGTDRLKEVIDWAAKRGLAIGAAVPAIETAIKNWGQPKSTGNGSASHAAIDW